MEALFLSVIKLAPVALSVVEVIKRVIPDRHRTVANPILAVVTGLIGAYLTGGTTELMEVLSTGVLAGAAAVGAYKIPKEIGSRMGIE